MSDSGNRSTVRRTARKSVKSASKTRKNSPNSLSGSAQQERAFKKLAKKAGIKTFTEEHKREVLAAVSAASVSGDFNENALVERLRTFKDVVKARKEEGLRAHAKALSRRKRRAEALKQQYEEEKETLAREIRHLAKRTGTKVSAKGMIHLAKVRAYGYSLSLADHMHLTKHINDRATQKIKEDLRSQADKDECDKCALRDYLELV